MLLVHSALQQLASLLVICGLYACICMYVWMDGVFICVLVFVLVCGFACVIVCLIVCLLVCLFVCLFV